MTTPVSTDTPLLPTPGRTIADILPAVLSRLDLLEAPDLGLPAADHWVVLLIDGLGRDLLDQHRQDAPVLAGAADLGGFTSWVPSTTATSITSLGTGVGPAQHGIGGYTFWLPEAGAVFHPLPWRPETPVATVQPIPTLFSRFPGMAQVSLPYFAGTGLTEATMAGAAFTGVEEEEAQEHLATVVAAAEDAPIVYTYDRRLDMAGHLEGCRSDAWLAELRRIDSWVGALRRALPEQTRLVVTGDHGMVDVPGRNHVIVADHRELGQGVRRIFGEPRFRHLHTEEPALVAGRWQQWLGDHAWVRTRADAIEEGWFGSPAAVAAGILPDRVGDVLVAMRSDWLVLSQYGEKEGQLVGHHGSLTPAEMSIPCLVM